MSNGGRAAQAAWLALAPVSVVFSEHCTEEASQLLYSMAGQLNYTGEIQLLVLLKAVQLPCVILNTRRVIHNVYLDCVCDVTSVERHESRSGTHCSAPGGAQQVC